MLSAQPEALSFANLEAPVKWVRGPKGLADLASDLAKVPHFAIDTETGGVAKLKEPLNARLSLIQLYIPRRDRWGNVSTTHGRLVVIDVLRLEQLAIQRGTDHAILEPLRNVLADPAIKKVIHHEAFERDQFARRNLSIEGVIDTERMSRTLRSDLLSFSLGAVNFEVRQVALDKGLQDSEWLKRPLDTEQMRYAALDPQETYHVWRALQQLDAAIALDCEATLESYCSELSKTRAAHAELLVNAQLDKVLARLVRAVELSREAIKQAALLEYNDKLEPSTRHTISSRYGSIVIGPHHSSKIDLEKLSALHPQVAQEVIRLSCTQDELSKAFRANGYDTKETKLLIDSLYVQKESAISAKIQPDEVLVDLPDGEIAAIFGISSKQSARDLMQKFVLLSAQLLALKRQAGIANDLAILERRTELLEGLIEGEAVNRAHEDLKLAAIENDYVQIKIKRSTHRQLDTPKLQLEYPQIAAAVLRSTASQKDLKTSFSQRGLAESEVDALVEEVTYLSHGSDQASVSIYPHYAIIYNFSRPASQQSDQSAAAAA